MQCQLRLLLTRRDFLRAIARRQSNPIRVTRTGGAFRYVYFAFRGCGFAPCSSTCFVTTIKQGNLAEPTREVDDDNNRQTSYEIVPQSEAAITADARLAKVQMWLETLERPV